MTPTLQIPLPRRPQGVLRASLLLAVLAACGGGEVNNNNPDADPSAPDAGPDAAPRDEWDDRLDERVLDYNAALRTAALRLTGELPTMTEIRAVQTAGDVTAQKAAYEGLITQYMASPKFAVQMVQWWQDTLKLGGDAEYQSAAAFAAQVTVEGRPYTDLFTAATGACGSFDMATSTFTAGDCANGVATHAGLLTHPGVHRQYYSNFAFRRVKWVQETFDCTKFPAEYAAEPIDVGGAAPYTGLFPFASVPDLSTGVVNFQDASAVVCANCHTTMNHIAPLFAYFDTDGQYQPTISVGTPLADVEFPSMADYLTAGETTAWRFGAPAADLPALGSAMAADPDVVACGIARVWNWALGKGDIVDTLRDVPRDVIQQQIDDFVADGLSLRTAIFNVYTSDDFVKF